MLKEAHIGQNRLCAGSKNRQDILGYKYIRHILSFKLRLIKGLLTFRCKIPTKSATRYKTLQNCIFHLIFSKPLMYRLHGYEISPKKVIKAFSSDKKHLIRAVQI